MLQFRKVDLTKPMLRSPQSSKLAAQAAAEFHRKQFGELAEAERKAAGLSGDLAKARAANQAAAS